MAMKRIKVAVFRNQSGQLDRLPMRELVNFETAYAKAFPDQEVPKLQYEYFIEGEVVENAMRTLGGLQRLGIPAWEDIAADAFFALIRLGILRDREEETKHAPTDEPRPREGHGLIR